AAGHHQISEKQVNRTAGPLPNFKSIAAGRGLQDRVTVELEDLNHNLAQGFFILGDKHSFATIPERVISDRIESVRWMLGRREVNPEDRPLVRFALNFHPPVMLPNNTKDRGQSQSSAFSNRFGGEEGLEYPVEDLRVHPAPRVSKRQANVLPFPRLRIHWSRPALQGLQGPTHPNPS